MKEERNNQKPEMDEKEREKQRGNMLIGVFFLVAIIFAISGVMLTLNGNIAAGIDRLLGAIALFALGIWYVKRGREY